MKVVFVSNYLNHHQFPFCQYMYKACEQFVFIATATKDIWGYQAKIDADYVCEYNEDNKSYVEKLILDADFVVFGSTPVELIQLRMSKNKLSFFYSERFFRRGVWRRWNPRSYFKLYRKIVKYRKMNMYVLCASAFLPYDLDLIGFPVCKCFKWGYFPRMIKYNNIESLLSTKEKNSIVWVSRLVNGKHPEAAIEVAKRLKNDGIDFKMNIIGDGELRDELEKTVDLAGLKDCTHILGTRSNDEVRSFMEKSEIFLFTSDKLEGWGAVINEAMNSACVTVASHAIGSVPFMLRDGENGFVYHSGNNNDLYDKVKYLINNRDEMRRMEVSAYQTIYKEWNAEVAGARLLELAQSILGGSMVGYDRGPCSKAKLIKDDWKK